MVQKNLNSRSYSLKKSEQKDESMVDDKSIVKSTDEAGLEQKLIPYYSDEEPENFVVSKPGRLPSNSASPERVDMFQPPESMPDSALQRRTPDHL